MRDAPLQEKMDPAPANPLLRQNHANYFARTCCTFDGRPGPIHAGVRAAAATDAPSAAALAPPFSDQRGGLSGTGILGFPGRAAALVKPLIET